MANDRFIVKVQQPLGGNAMDKLLVTSEEGAIRYLVPFTARMRRIMGEHPKRYFFARDERDLLVRSRLAPDQDW